MDLIVIRRNCEEFFLTKSRQNEVGFISSLIAHQENVESFNLQMFGAGSICWTLLIQDFHENCHRSDDLVCSLKNILQSAVSGREVDHPNTVRK